MRPIALTLGIILGIASGCGGDGGASADSSAANSPIEVTGTDALAFEPSELTVPAGEVTVELTAEPGVNHTFVVEGVDDDGPVVEAAAGETATGTVELASGEYTAYCSVPGHRDAGMEATLTVS